MELKKKLLFLRTPKLGFTLSNGYLHRDSIKWFKIRGGISFDLFIFCYIYTSIYVALLVFLFTMQPKLKKFGVGTNYI